MYFCYVFILLCTMLWQYVPKYVMLIKQYELRERERERVRIETRLLYHK